MTTNYYCMVYHTTTASTPPNVKLSSAIPKIKWSKLLAICFIIQSTPDTPGTTVSMKYPCDRLKTALGFLYGTILTGIAENPDNHKSTRGAFS